MAGDSDSEDDTQIKQVLEAADTSLLNNDMFRKKDDAILKKEASEGLRNEVKELDNNLPKSQRYVIEDTENSGVDFRLPESMQKHLAKKFNEISQKYYEFCDAPAKNVEDIKTKHKSRVKLLKDSDCFVHPYKELEYDTKGPTKKPVIKRRIVDDVADYCDINDDLKTIAIDGNFLLSGQEVNAWAKKKERKDKVFYYKMASNGSLHAKEEINEFTEIRKKNKWNENKIKNFRKT